MDDVEAVRQWTKRSKQCSFWMPNSVRVLLGDNGQLVELPTSGISNRVVVFENLRTMPSTTTTSTITITIANNSTACYCTIHEEMVSGERRSRTIEPCGIGFLLWWIGLIKLKHDLPEIEIIWRIVFMFIVSE
ncbi:hypothetical protein HZH68_010342 [Vespula germanica]|uniref:Uncharacterized protein n=1 Tax=Vespula germanica TaxID=30212 RepID=A0A834JRE3_VESGE|nr:hypothetical protein HZH68_010342 [Vespula germanica]